MLHYLATTRNVFFNFNLFNIYYYSILINYLLNINYCIKYDICIKYFKNKLMKSNTVTKYLNNFKNTTIIV